MTNLANTLVCSFMSRTVRALLAASCALVGALTIGVAQAPGLVTHPYLSRITEVPAVGPHGEIVGLPGELQQVRGVTVDAAHHLLAAGDGQHGEQLDEFDGLSGGFLAQLSDRTEGNRTEGNGIGGIAVDRSNGYLYAGRYETVAVLDGTGALLKTWSGTPIEPFGNDSIQGVAVDNDPTTLGGDWAAGDVFVATATQIKGTEYTDQAVDVFKPKPGGEEEYVTRITGVSPSEPFSKSSHLRAVAVDEANGDVLVADGNVVDVFRPSTPGEYELVRQIAGTPEGPFAYPIDALAVDAGTGEIYIVEEEGHGPIYEFGETGTYRGRLTGTPTGAFAHVLSVAADSANHHLYVAEQAGIDFFGEGVTIPDVSTELATGLTTSSATLHGSVNPMGEGRANCRFLWGTSEELGETASCPSEYEGNAAQKVEVELTNLQPGATYYYRLEASNKNGTNASEEATASCEGHRAIDACFTTPGPGFREQWAENVSATAATLHAMVDPHGKPTGAYLEYGSCASLSACATSPFTASVPAAPGEALGSGLAPIELNPQHVQGLSAGTVYHYRVVALSEMKPGEVVAFHGPEETFTTQTTGVAGLPDGRTWELVSPANKHGALVEVVGTEGGLTQAATGGGAFIFYTNQPPDENPAGYANQVQVLAVRSARGWSSKDIDVPHAPATGKAVGVGGAYRFFSEDLSYGIVQPEGAFIPASSPQAIAPGEASEQTAFLREDLNGSGGICTSGCYRPLVTGMPGHANVWEPGHTHFGEEGVCPYTEDICGPLFEAASPDGQHVIVGSKTQLTATPTPAGQDQLYEWSAGKLTLVSVLPNGEPFVGVLGPKMQADYASAKHVVSDDGNRVVWQTEGAGRKLYMTDTQTGKSVQLDAVQGGSGKVNGGESELSFMAASADGSRVFFTDDQQLTENAGAEGRDLYECAIAIDEAGTPVCTLSDLTPAGLTGSANVDFGLPGVSEDGEWVYFVADGVLENKSVPVPGAVHGACVTSSSNRGALCNLYVRHGGVTRLVAVISQEDEQDWGVNRSGDPKDTTARVSPDGQWFAFMSSRSLTGYDNRDVATGTPDEELYLYHAGVNGGAGELVCASCDPTGARPTGVEAGEVFLADGLADWHGTTRLAANVPGWTPYSIKDALYQSRYLSDEGRLFFDSPGALVPQDVNGTWDVYEYEPPGVGGCTTSLVTYSARSRGCVALISSGESAAESAFMDASETGGDVFFLTLSKLVPQDYDTAYDVYDAHECTSLSPCLTETPQPPPCTTADACRGAVTPQPEVFGAPSSATFTGNGNVPAAASGGAAVVTKSKSPTRAQRLSQALRACRGERRQARRAGCEASARRRYGAASRNGHAKRSSIRGKGGK